MASYVAIGRSDKAVGGVRRLLEETGAMASTTLVAAPGSGTAAAKYIAPFTAAAIAKATRDNGGSALVRRRSATVVARGRWYGG